MRPHLTCVLVLLATSGAAIADDGCGKFAWPVARDRAALRAPNLPMVPSGSAIDSKRAFRLGLLPAEQANYAMPPERKPRIEDWRGGVVHLAAPPRAGVYQLTLSQDAWVDMLQAGRYARSVGSSGRSDCPGLRKSVRFELTAAPIVVQISGVTADTISLVFGRAR
jgi:hypothetical protein